MQSYFTVEFEVLVAFDDLSAGKHKQEVLAMNWMHACHYVRTRFGANSAIQIDSVYYVDGRDHVYLFDRLGVAQYEEEEEKLLAANEA